MNGSLVDDQNNAPDANLEDGMEFEESSIIREILRLERSGKRVEFQPIRVPFRLAKPVSTDSQTVGPVPSKTESDV
jgi:hypothetical protein